MKINWQYFVMGLAVGGAVGFVWGLFNAPYSGAETQRLIAERLQESLAEGQQAMAAREQELRQALERSKGRGT